MLTDGGAHACNRYQLVVVLLLCAIPATVQYCRQVRRHTPALTVRPPRVIYELRGDITHPGIYRFKEEQTRTALAAACAADYAFIYDTDKTIATGSRLVFNKSETETTHMDAARLMSYYLQISLATATLEDLELIPGIGPKTANALIDYHERNGPLNRIEQLSEVRGIGPKTLKKITRYLRP